MDSQTLREGLGSLESPWSLGSDDIEYNDDELELIDSQRCSADPRQHQSRHRQATEASRAISANGCLEAPGQEATSNTNGPSERSPIFALQNAYPEAGGAHRGGLPNPRPFRPSNDTIPELRDVPRRVLTVRPRDKLMNRLLATGSGKARRGAPSKSWSTEYLQSGNPPDASAIQDTVDEARGEPLKKRNLMDASTLGSNADGRAPKKCKKAQREFLVQSGEDSGGDESDDTPIYAPKSKSKASIPQLPRETASRTTPFDQLCYSNMLIRENVANKRRWNRKANHSPNTTFVITHQVGSPSEQPFTNLKVIPTLKEANLEALNVMARNHPEAFAALSPSVVSEQTFENVEDEEHACGWNMRDILAKEKVKGYTESTRGNSGDEASGQENKTQHFLYQGQWRFAPNNTLKLEATLPDGQIVRVSSNLRNARLPPKKRKRGEARGAKQDVESMGSRG